MNTNQHSFQDLTLLPLHFFLDKIIKDMMIIPEDDSIPPNVPWKPSINVTDGADALFQQQYLANLQVMKRANMKDLSVVIQQTQHQEQQQQRNGRTDWHERQRDRQRQEGSGIMKKELNARIDMIEYDTGSIDGPVEFCWQSMSANTKVPQRLMLNITQHSTIGLQEKEQRAHQKKELVQEHLPRIEADLHGMDRKIQMILSNADFAKDQEIEFHTMSTRMNKATKYWPMIHVTVLFLTGLTQANHIVKFFKERHIF